MRSRSSSRNQASRPPHATVRRVHRSLVHHFGTNDVGSVAIIFAVVLGLALTVAGGAVDYNRWSSAKNSTLYAMDAAVLAGGRALQLGNSPADAIEIARNYYSKNRSPLLDIDNVTFTIENNNTEVVAVSNSRVKTSFLGLAGIPELRVHGIARSVLSASGNTGSHVEIALMLDATGSMGGIKMEALQEAASDLVRIVIWDDQSRYTSRLAVVPFAPYVNVGRMAFEAATNSAPTGSGNEHTCVKERTGENRYSDATPSETNGFFARYTGANTCKPVTSIMPLSANKDQLIATIDALGTSGLTAGHIGTQWAWYVLSPNFAALWPSASQPKNYDLLSQFNADGQPLLRKIAVLMTDGEYNKKYSGDSSTVQARAICDSMKAAGIEIFTVGFEIIFEGQADMTMRHCASSPNHYYSADGADALKSAFRDIALKISTLRLKE